MNGLKMLFLWKCFFVTCKFKLQPEHRVDLSLRSAGCHPARCHSTMGDSGATGSPGTNPNPWQCHRPVSTSSPTCATTERHVCTIAANCEDQDRAQGRCPRHLQTHKTPDLHTEPHRPRR